MLGLLIILLLNNFLMRYQGGESMEFYQPYSLLFIPIIFVVLLFCVKLADSICQQGKLTMQSILKWFKTQWKTHICSEYDGPEECFECNHDDQCGECPVLLKIAMTRKD